jgi:glycine/D-amino acid oxidase-like deaminating enzyme
MKTVPYWTDITPRPDDLPLSDLPPSVDIAIIGSGYTGLNAALTLAKAGADVAVLEAGYIAFGGSSRNGGMFSPGISAGIQKIEQRHGPEIADRMWRWSLEATEYVKRLIREENIDCDLIFNGGLHLAWRPGHLEEDRRHIRYMRSRFGVTDLHIVEREQLQEEIGSPAYFGGMVNDNAGSVDPAKYVYGLARVAAREGVKLVESTEVQEISRPGGIYRLHTTAGSTEASQVLIATNGYTSRLVPEIRRGILPIGSSIIITEPLDESTQNEISPKGRTFYDSKNFLNYFHLTAEGRMMFGGRRKLSPNLDPVRSAPELHGRLLEVFPQLKDVPITHSWTGNVAFTYDRTPHIGQVGGIYYAYGYNGHGLAASSYMGREVAKLMNGDLQDSPFFAIPHPRIPMSGLSDQYLPLLTLWFRVLDRFA